MQSSLGSSTQYGIILFDFQAMSRPAVFIVVLVYAIVAGKDSFSLDLIISFHQSPAGQERDAGLVDTAETRNLVRREASPGRKNAKKVSRTRKSKKRTKKSKACKCKNGEERGKRKGKRKSYKKETRQSNFQSCFSKIFKYTSKLKKARNIQNQAKRINGTKEQMKLKLDKKVDILLYLYILVVITEM